MSASVALLPIGPGSRNSTDTRPHPPHQASSARTLLAAPRPTHSLPRPHLLKINIDNQKASPMPRRGTGNLALQARDSVAIRKRTLSTGTMSPRAARLSARKSNGNPEALQASHIPSLAFSATNLNVASGSGRGRPHSRSRSPAGTPSTRTDSHPKHRSLSRSPSTSSSSPSQSSTPITPGHPALSGAPSSFNTRAHTHVPNNSQGTTTSAYPASSSHSSRSSSASPERSRTPSPLPPPQKAPAPHTPVLELDPDDVNARLRLLVNNSYFLPPAHVKPELSPIFLSPSTIRSTTTSPSAFKEFFRVGKKKEKKSFEQSDFTTPKGRRIMPLADLPPGAPDGRMLVLHSPEGPTRNRVVVVRETLDDLPLPVIRPPHRSSSLPTHLRPRTAPQPDTTFIDPTTQYDVPPPTHFPSYADLGLDAAGITGNVQLDQFVPPGEPWSPAASRGSGMDSQERVWRRAILEQAVDLSLSSAASDPGHVSGGTHDIVFARPSRLSSDNSVPPQSPRSVRSKKGWWGRKDKDVEETVRRPSTSSSNKEREIPRQSSEHVPPVLDISQPTSSANVMSKRNLGQRILPNVNTADLDELERIHALQKGKEHNVEFCSQLRLPLSALSSSVSVPTSPFYSESAELPMTPLRPRPVRPPPARRLNAFEDTLANEFLPGHSTIKKSLSSPLLSDMHETEVNVEELPPLPNSSTESFDGVAAPSLVLRDPHGVTSLVDSNPDSFITAVHSDDDMFDVMTSPTERHFGCDDSASMGRWSTAHSNPDGRPSFDSFNRVRSPESGRPARASSTFGFRCSNISVSVPPPLLPLNDDIEVDITGDPIEHLAMMQHQRSISPGGESQSSSLRGYASAVDHTFYGSETLSVRPTSPASQSFLSTKTRLPSVNPPSDYAVDATERERLASISFFDSVQRQSYMDADGTVSESDVDVDEPPDTVQTALYDQRPARTQALGRKSLNTIRPARTLTTQFRNASQPQLPLSRPDHGPTSFSIFRPYDLLDRKKPLSNIPISSPSVSSGILSQLRSNKGPTPFAVLNKAKATLPTMLATDSTSHLMQYPPGSTISLASSAKTASDAGHVQPQLTKMMSQRSLPSLRASDAASVRQLNSRPEQTVQDESLRKLDGMVLQHLEAEKDRLRKIATAAREKGGVDRVF